MSAMAPQRLHTRKRGPHLHEVAPNSVGAAMIDSSKEESKLKKTKIQYAFVAFSLGLGLGLLIFTFWFEILNIDRSQRRRSSSPRFVTVIEHSEVDPSHRHRRLKSIQDTWGPSARAIFVVTDITDYSEAVNNGIISETKTLSPQNLACDYPKLLVVPQEVGAERSTPYLKYITRAVFERVNPDFAFFVNDHSYAIPEHLCSFLEEKDPSLDMYAGHGLRVGKETFHPNSAGYLLSRSTMQKLVQQWNDHNPICVREEPHPGLAISRCLEQILNVSAERTRQNNRLHRFHAFPLMRLVTGGVDQWYNELSAEQNLYGNECCANDTVSFHYVEYLESRALFAVRKALQGQPQMPNDELKTLLVELWPTTDIGGYSRGLPKFDDIETWEVLLSVIRSISSRPDQESVSEC